MFPILGRLGPITFYSYTVILAAGLLAALAWLWRRARRRAVSELATLDAALGAIVGGVIGARAGYVFANWSYFSSHWVEALLIWSGGLAAPGAVVGAVAGLALFARRAGEPFKQLFDELALPGLFLSALAWLGCAFAGCAPGLQVAPGQVPFAVDWPDMYGIYALRWPAQLIGAGLSALALFILAATTRVSWPQGRVGLTAVALMGAIAAFVGLVRGDEMQTFGGVRLDVIANSVLFLTAIASALVWWATQPAPSSNGESSAEQA